MSGRGLIGLGNGGREALDRREDLDTSLAVEVDRRIMLAVQISPGDEYRFHWNRSSGGSNDRTTAQESSRGIP